jgi:hypothetical protein
MTEQHTLRIALARPEDLFAVADYAPLEGRFERLTGMERLVTGMEEAPRDARHIIEIALPAATSDIEAAIRTAIAGYCETEIAASRFLMRVTRKRGLLALRVGLPILAACLALSTAVAAWKNDGVGPLLSNTFIIAGWVALWQPAELLLYDWWPPYHRINLLRRIAEAEVRMVVA